MALHVGPRPRLGGQVRRRRAHLGDSSLEHVVFDGQDGGVHRGDHQHGHVWVAQRAHGKVERDVDPTAVKESDGLEVT